MMKKKVIYIGAILFVVVMLTGCFDSNYVDGKLHTTKGKLIDVINDSNRFTFVFKDDTYVNLNNLGKYNLTEVEQFINFEIEMKYAGDFSAKLVSIKVL